MEEDEDFFKIDELNLEKEWVRQPELYWKYAELLAEARMNYEKSKSDRDVAMAELDRDIRSNPENYGISKITEKIVENSIILTKKYNRVNSDVIKAKHNLDLTQGKVDTLDHKKKAIEGLVHLWTMNYYSEPRASKESKEQMQEVEKRSTRGKVKFTNQEQGKEE